MWKFGKLQKTFSIGEVNVGGSPGEHPTVLVGTIFYHGHKIVSDEKKGDFDRKKAEELIRLQEDYSGKTGNPHVIDVVGSTPEAMERYIDFVAKVTDAPISMDGVASSVRIAGLEYVRQSGLADRIIYNSITPEFKEEELEKIKDAKVKSAFLLAFNTKDFTSAGRISAIESLLPQVAEAGIEMPLIDTCVLDIPSLGMACRALFELKDKYGLPVGCGAHNAVGSWRGLKQKMGEKAKEPCMAAASVMSVVVGADFVLYGPIGAASYMFPAVALVDAAYAQLAIEQGKMPDRTHPIFRIA